MERARLVATLIVLVQTLGFAFLAIAYVEQADPDLLWWEYADTVLFGGGFYLASLGLWRCVAWGPRLATALLIASSVVCLAEPFFVAVESGVSGGVGLELLWIAILLHLLNHPRVAEACRSGTRFSHLVGIWTKVIGYPGAFLLTGEFAGWTLAAVIVISLVVVREFPRLRTRRAATPGGRPLADD
jgi:hypothetical protein